jgi:large subunit ribosomal protein L25
MAEILLEAEVRISRGRQSRALRRSGKIPGVYYAHGEENIAIAATEKALRPLVGTKEAHIINLKLDSGKALNCILRDVQYDPLTDLPIHFDLQGIKADEELTIEVPVILQGIPAGVKNGGIMQHIMHTVRVSCLPRYIPEHIALDVAALEINTSIHISDIKLENVTILDNEENAIVAIIPPAAVVEEVAPVAETEVPVEPEVIGKGKKPEEGAEGAEESKKAEAPKKAEASKKEEKK